MISFIEPLQKSKDKISFGWKPEPINNVFSYNIYVGLSPNTLNLLASGIPNIASPITACLGKINYVAQISDVQNLLSITTDFSDTVFYFAITYVDINNIESNITDSLVVEVPPVGIMPRFMKEDPTINRHLYAFNNNIQRWLKVLGSEQGSVVVDACDLYKSNITIEYTYDSSNISTILSYPTGAVSGSPAKLTTYSYSGDLVKKVIITDSTVL